MTQMNADSQQTSSRFRIVATLRRQLVDPDFYSGEFAIIGIRSGFDSFSLSVREVQA